MAEDQTSTEDIEAPRHSELKALKVIIQCSGMITTESVWTGIHQIVELKTFYPANTHTHKTTHGTLQLSMCMHVLDKLRGAVCRGGEKRVKRPKVRRS